MGEGEERREEERSVLKSTIGFLSFEGRENGVEELELDVSGYRSGDDSTHDGELSFLLSVSVSDSSSRRISARTKEKGQLCCSFLSIHR